MSHTPRLLRPQYGRVSSHSSLLSGAKPEKPLQVAPLARQSTWKFCRTPGAKGPHQSGAASTPAAARLSSASNCDNAQRQSSVSLTEGLMLANPHEFVQVFSDE